MMLKHHLHQFHFGNRFLVFENCFHLRYRFQIQLEFVKQYLDNGEFTLNYCPTEDMIADILT